jgi:hypothetical protein
MRWECGECGECEDGARPPTVCASCGIAGGMFVLRDPEPDDASADQPRLLWTRMGLDARAPVEARWSR